MGAWIEIVLLISTPAGTYVAPLVGAWIEMFLRFMTIRSGIVAPLVGAWIEISVSSPPRATESRRSPCGSVD